MSFLGPAYLRKSITLHMYMLWFEFIFGLIFVKPV